MRARRAAAAMRLGWRLQRAGGRSSAAVLGLSVACFAVSSALLLLVVGGYGAFTDRTDRTAWRSPEAVPASAAAAVVASTVEPADGRVLTVLDVARLPGAVIDPPPGLDRLPEPGEVLVSPALDRLLRQLPDEQLAQRFAGTARGPGTHVAGSIGLEGLAHAEELVAVVGRSVDDPVLDPHSGVVRGPSAMAARAVSTWPTSTRGLDVAGAPVEALYPVLALVAAVLLVVPVLALGGSAARLGVARRDRRLATLRLAGATSGQVTVLTAVEALVAAAVGAVAGAVLHALVLAPLVGTVSFQGGALGAAALWPPPAQVALVLVGTVVLGGLSAVLGLRQVVVTPLGVTQRVTPRGLRAVRLLFVVAALVGWTAVTRSPAALGATVGVSFLLALFGAVNLVGPWVVWVTGRVGVRRARSAQALLAARRLLDDPKGAWRGVAGLALAGFVAGCLTVVPALAGITGGQGRPDLEVRAPASLGAPASTVTDPVAAAVDQRLADAGVPADVTAAAPAPGDAATVVTVELHAPGNVEVAQTAVTGLVEGAVVASAAGDDLPAVVLAEDLRTGALVTLAVAFLLAAVSAGINQAAAVLDQRRTLQLATLAGAPVQVLLRARTRQVLLPLVTTVALSVGSALLFVLPLFGNALLRDPSGIALLAGCLTVGALAVVAAVNASSPLLRQVAARLPEPVD